MSGKLSARSGLVMESCTSEACGHQVAMASPNFGDFFVYFHRSRERYEQNQIHVVKNGLFHQQSKQQADAKAPSASPKKILISENDDIKTHLEDARRGGRGRDETTRNKVDMPTSVTDETRCISKVVG